MLIECRLVYNLIYCDQIGQFPTDLGDKSSLNHFLNKNCCGYVWGIFVENLATFIIVTLHLSTISSLSFDLLFLYQETIFD